MKILLIVGVVLLAVVLVLVGVFIWSMLCAFGGNDYER